MKRISVYVPKMAAIEAISPAYRLFKTANQFLMASGNEPAFQVEYVGLENVISTNDGEYSVKIDRLISEVSQTDLVIIPALYGNMNTAIEANFEAINWVKNMYKNGAEVASLCVGAFLLASTGLVEGKKCSTHWAYYQEFKNAFPKVEIVEGKIITDEGRLYSSGGANSIWNLLLYLLEKYTDRSVAILASKYFAIDIDRNSQNAFTIFTGQKGHKDPEILKIQNFVETNFTEKLSLDQLAERANLSRRSFERRFKNATSNTLVEYLQRVRIEAAKRNFESSRKNVSEVMYEVGYSDTKAFRDVFKRITGLTPIEYRNKFSKV
ncbi:MAG: helix-turn-helix domain-containing protein [Spirosomataceae bacterium]|jgi:transcriptional regulator GlxA family with amidase domain